MLLKAGLHVRNELAICSDNLIITLNFLVCNAQVVFLYSRPTATNQLIAPVFHDNEKAVACLFVRQLPFNKRSITKIHASVHTNINRLIVTYAIPRYNDCVHRRRVRFEHRVSDCFHFNLLLCLRDVNPKW